MYIDLSKYNKVTNWGLVKNNVEGAILRVGYRGYGSGKIVIDDMFETFAKMCYNNGIPFGLYFMSQAITVIEAMEEADFAMSYADKYKATLPIFIDSEDGDGKPTIVRADALNKNDRTTICDIFCKTIENENKKSGVYASTDWFKNRLDVSKLCNHILWVAQYGPKCTATHRIDMWQYTSKGSVPGINGNVDCTVVYGFPLEEDTELQTFEVLRMGSRGVPVIWLQERLNKALKANLLCDGIFGSKTELAVKDYQRQNGLTVDGIAGRITQEKLRAV